MTAATAEAISSSSVQGSAVETEKMTEDIHIRRKRLRYRSRYTGMKETDLLLGGFAERYLAAFDDAQLDQYEHILGAGDGRIFDWITGKEDVPATYGGAVMDLLLNFKIEA